jgi:hypothetical protein
MELQLDATIIVLMISKISSICFGQTFAHLQERNLDFLQHMVQYPVMWYAGVSERVVWH